VKGALLVLLLSIAACVRLRPVRTDAEDARNGMASLQQRIAVLRESSQLEVATDPDRCRKRGAVADEICHCADRICALAEDLADDAAHRACAQAREDCQRARSNADACK
jgi:hypothetical protein